MGSFQNSITVFNTDVISSTITRPANQTQYTAGDAVSDATANAHHSFKWTSSLIRAPITGLISNARITTSVTTATQPDLELWLFDEDIAAIADNAAFTITDAEMLTCIGVIDFPVADWKASALNAGCFVENIGLAFKAKSSTIYGQLVMRNTYTPPADSQTFTVSLAFAKDSD